MAAITVTYTLANGNTIDAGELNQNFTDILNGLSDSTKDISVNAVTAAGNFTFSGNGTFGSASGDDLTVNGSIASNVLIKTTNTYSLGSSSAAFQYMYLAAGATNTVRLGAATASSSWNLTLPDGPGSAGFIPQTDGSGNLTWVPGATDTNTVTDANYSITNTDGYRTVLFDTGSSDRTAGLPSAASANAGRFVTFKKINSDAGDVVVNSAVRLVDDGDYVTYYSDGSSWIITDIGGTIYSELWYTSGNGNGSSSNKIKRFSTATLVTGRAIEYSDSAADGASFTIGRDGLYSIEYADEAPAAFRLGLTVDETLGSTGTTTITSIAYGTKIAMDGGAAGAESVVTAVLKLSAGAVVRPHHDGNPNGAGDAYFRIVQLQKL